MNSLRAASPIAYLGEHGNLIPLRAADSATLKAFGVTESMRQGNIVQFSARLKGKIRSSSEKHYKSDAFYPHSAQHTFILRYQKRFTMLGAKIISPACRVCDTIICEAVRLQQSVFYQTLSELRRVVVSLLRIVVWN